MIVLHGLKTCDTCRKALKELASSGIDARLRDLRTDPVTPAELARWSADFGPALLNTRSTTWRSLTPHERGIDPVELMTTHPALIKRPVVESPDHLCLGWTEDTRRTFGIP